MTVGLTTWFDNRVKPGVFTKDALLSALRGAGVEATTKEDIFSEGSLIRTTLRVEDASGATAKTTAEGQPGVLSVGPVLADPLGFYDLTNMTLATLTFGGAADDQEIRVSIGPDEFDSDVTALGWTNSGSGGFSAQNKNLDGYRYCVVQFYNKHTASLDLPAGDLSLTYDGGSPLALDNAATISVAAPTMGTNRKSYYVDVNGKMYLAEVLTDGTLIRPFLSYEQAVAGGAA